MFICKKWNLQMYSIAKIHYTTITMNKEGMNQYECEYINILFLFMIQCMVSYGSI